MLFILVAINISRRDGSRLDSGNPLLESWNECLRFRITSNNLQCHELQRKTTVSSLSWNSLTSSWVYEFRNIYFMAASRRNCTSTINRRDRRHFFYSLLKKFYPLNMARQIDFYWYYSEPREECYCVSLGRDTPFRTPMCKNSGWKKYSEILKPSLALQDLPWVCGGHCKTKVTAGGQTVPIYWRCGKIMWRVE